jgi:hypothetical protein
MEAEKHTDTDAKTTTASPERFTKGLIEVASKLGIGLTPKDVHLAEDAAVIELAYVGMYLLWTFPILNIVALSAVGLALILVHHRGD